MRIFRTRRIEMITIGEKAPDFTLTSGEGKEISLSDFLGKKVVLYFYPKDYTSGCTTEACQFRDSFGDFESAETVVLGVSPDTEKSHQNFTSKYDLPFILLADKDKEVIRLYDAEKEKNMYGKKVMGVERSTFIINEEGILVKEYRKVKADGHADAVLQDIKEL